MDCYEAVAGLDGGTPDPPGVLYAEHGQWRGLPSGLSASDTAAVLEAHELAFPYFGGVIGRLRYDNLASAVKKTNSGGEGRKCAFAWGKPIPAAFVESFNGKFLHACLNAHWFVDLPHARRRIGACNIHYNTGRPA